MDIIPWLAGNNYPRLDKKKPILEGDYVYFLEIYVHQNIGPGKEDIVCPARNYGLPCPICEDIDTTYADAEYEAYQKIATKRRCAYQVVVYSDNQEKKGIQIWEVSYKYSQEPILLQATNPRTGGVEPFSDPDVGSSISFQVANNKYRNIAGHKLVPRDYKISDEILSATRALDQDIILLPYDEIKRMYLATEIAEGEVAAPATTGASRGRHAATDNSGKATEETKAPPARMTRQQESATTAESGDVSDPCPNGGKFGIDIDTLQTCGECKSYNACSNRAEEIKKEAAGTADPQQQASSRPIRRPQEPAAPEKTPESTTAASSAPRRLRRG
jgi:hypothetical protein